MQANVFPPRIWKSNKMNFHHPSWVKYPCACEWHSAGQRQMSSLFTFGLGAACQVWNTDFCVLSKASSLQDRHFSSNFLPKMHNTTTMKSLGCWFFFPNQNQAFTTFPSPFFVHSSHPRPKNWEQQFTLWALPPNLYLFLNLPHYFKVICRNLMHFRLLSSH